MNPIVSYFQRLRSMKRKAFIPFVTAGDPDLDTTAALIQELARRGGGPIEVGFPYSDPIADGSIIQASYTRALNRGVRVEDIIRTIRNLTGSASFQRESVPLISMVSYSLVHHRGPEEFIVLAQAAGISGAIVPDLPVEEADALGKLAAKLDFTLSHLVTPTTPRDRAVRIASSSTGFLYVVSVTGITGERVQLPAELLDQLRWLRTQTDLPLCVGFGISKPEHVHMLRDHVDGIIVGSALVRRMERAGERANIIQAVGDLAESLASALNP